ncbi:MarR family winged helix-turn-helix transcriptional regulator [Agrococcus baldri]|nr:MarR family transcriptional regulator [Agrococcus baldri]
MPLAEQLSTLVNRWSSHRFQLAHASRLHNERDFTANKVLYLLGSNGPMRPSELATEVGTGRANVSKVVARLESDGLVARSLDETDARATLVSLTARGEVVSSDVFTIGEEMIAELTAGWTRAERATLTSLLERLNAATERYERRLTTRSRPTGSK